MKLAIDIGTTTIALCLFDEDSGYRKDAVFANPNRLHGADVISRMNNIIRQDLGTVLQNELLDAIVGSFFDMAGDDGITKDDLNLVVVSGNTAMTHIINGWDVSGMVCAPFTPYSTFAFHTNFKNIPVMFMPAVSAFIGGDVVSGISALSLNEKKEPAMLIDLGTNGEIVLSVEGNIYASSVAAGPAFEGANISIGMPAVAGAIDTVSVKRGFCRFSTIEGLLPPKGICGSGLIDAVCALLCDGIIDRHGSYISDLHRHEGFPLYPGNPPGRRLALTQKDIRSLQTAKSAVHAGIYALCNYASVAMKDISTIYLAGSFGKYLDTENAVTIGLLPRIDGCRIIASGNTSLEGAIRLAQNPSLEKNITKTASSATSVSLADSEAFKDAFIRFLDF